MKIQDKYEVRDDYDGVIGDKVYYTGTREECLKFIRKVWRRWTKLGCTPSLCRDGGFPVSFVA